jgi:hypothetical protein
VPLYRQVGRSVARLRLGHILELERSDADSTYNVQWRTFGDAEAICAVRVVVDRNRPALHRERIDDRPLCCRL